MNKDSIRSILATIENPAIEGDLVSSGALQWIAWCETYGSLKLHFPRGVASSTLDRLAKVVHGAIGSAAVGAGGRLDSLIVEFVDDAGAVTHTARFGAFTGGTGRTGATDAGHRPIGGLAPAAERPPAKSAAPTPQGAAPSLPGVRHAIAVGAGKGGVGKSTVAVNLAVGLARKGHAVGLLDADIYGPSLPTMLGLAPLEQAVHEGHLVPFAVHGIKAVTIGKLVDAERPLIWRGPMAHGAFKQLLDQTHWGTLDYLIIDLPPGTGDIALTMAQQLQLTGAVVVCTPQKVAQDDAVRAARMFQQLGISVLGVVENMSSFIADDGKEYDLFGKGGAQMMAQRLGVPFLGEVPITMSLRVNSDSGNPTSNFTGTSTADQRLTRSLEALVASLTSQIALTTLRGGTSRPTLSIC
jgi:ATP-binding protein involved in chromosome partitioning